MTAEEIEKLEGLKHRDFSNCIFCRKGMMHAGEVVFYRVKVEQCMIMLGAVQRAHAMEMLVGDARIANAMGPDEDLAKILPSEYGLVCGDCAMRREECVALIKERQPRKEGDA